MFYAQPEKKQAKELCIIGGEYLDNRFSTQQYKIQGKLNKDKEGGNSQPSKHQEKDNTELCIIFLILYLR